VLALGTTTFACIAAFLLPHSSLITSVGTKVAEGFTLFMAVKLQPMITDKRNHKTSNCTVQPSVLKPHYEKMKTGTWNENKIQVHSLTGNIYMRQGVPRSI